MKKKQFCLVVAILMILCIFAGCAPAEQSPSGDPGEPGTPDTPPGEDQITLTFPHWYWSHGGSFDEWINGACKDFTDANPGVTIEPITIAYEEYWDKLDIAIAAGTPYDIMAFGDNIGNYIENGHILALDNYVDMQELKTHFTDIQNVAIPDFAPDGKTYLIANVNAFYMPIYRPSILKKAGWDAFPTDFEGFKALCADLKSAGVTPYGMMTNPGNFTEQWLDLSVWVIGQGGSWTKDGKPAFDTPEVANAYRCIKELYDLDYIVKDTDKGTYRQMFGTGEVGVLIDGPWVYSTAVIADPTVEGDFAVAPTSLFAANQYAAAWEGFAASSKTKYPEECGKLLMSLTSATQMRKFLDVASILSPRTDTFDDPAYKEQTLQKFPWMQTFVDGSERAKDIYPTGVPVASSNEFQKIAGAALESILYDGVSVEDAMQTAQDAAMQLLS